MKFGSFFLNRPLLTFHAMAADEIPLHFDMDDLTETQQQDHFEQPLFGQLLSPDFASFMEKALSELPVEAQ